MLAMHVVLAMCRMMHCSPACMVLAVSTAKLYFPFFTLTARAGQEQLNCGGWGSCVHESGSSW